MISITETIKKINLFAHLDNASLEKLASISYLSKFEKNSILYYESDSVDKILFLITGLIKVYKIDKYDNEIFLYYVYPNSMISELSNINHNQIRCFSNTEFIEDSLMLAINFKKFKDEFLLGNELIVKFIEEIIYKNQQLQCIVNRELVFDATSKVAFMLSNDLEMFNQLKRNQVALMLHIQPETLSRVLKRLVRNKTINVDKGIVMIENLEELQSIYLGV